MHATASLESPETAQLDRQVVALQLADETYGVDISMIHTVITPQLITPIPKTPKYIKGVMNLRGRIVPIIDLRSRFDLPPMNEQIARSHRIVIVDIEGICAGLTVDSVSEVLRLPLNMIEPSSGMIHVGKISDGPDDFITGIGRIPKEASPDGKPERLILLFDVHKAITSPPRREDEQKLAQMAA